MTIPTGSAAWARSSTVEDYGGHSNKHDLGYTGSINEKTDVAAAEYLRACADLVVAVRTAPLFWLSFTVSTGPLAASVTQCQPMWAPASGPYSGASPPSSLYPTIVANGTWLDLTFPGLTSLIAGAYWITATDEYGVSGACQMSHVITCEVDSSSTVTSALLSNGTLLRMFNATTAYSTVYLVVR